MARSPEITATPALGSRSRMSDMYLIAIACFMLFGILTAAAFAIGPLQSQPAGTTTQAEALDGWLPAVTVANRERALSEANAVVDGWSTALLKQDPDVTDGWAAALLKPEPHAVDGWAARYLVDGD
jgi:hypothetical protein